MLFFAVLPISLNAQAAETDQPAEELGVEVRRLVVELNDESLQRRHAAEEALLKLGPDVLGWLPSASPQIPVEVQQRLKRVRTALEKAAAESLAAPSRVTLSGRMELGHAMEALEQASGNWIVGYQERGVMVSTDFDDVTYWEALDQILDEAELSINNYGGQPNVLVVFARRPAERLRSGHGVYVGPFRFEPLRLQSWRDLRNPIVDGTRLTIEVAWEPRLSPISLRQPFDQLEIYDDTGQRTVPRNPEGVANVPIEPGLSAVDLEIPLQLPSRSVRQLSAVRGELTAILPGQVQAFEFGDLLEARDVKQQKAGVHVTLEMFRKNVDLYEARMRVRFDDPADALESHRGWIFRNKAFLRGPEGETIENVGMQTTRQQVDEVGLAYLFHLEQDPTELRFVYETPVVILQVPVAYELRDIPLP
jgi:hypothetical protein